LYTVFLDREADMFVDIGTLAISACIIYFVYTCWTEGVL